MFHQAFAPSSTNLGEFRSAGLNLDLSAVSVVIPCYRSSGTIEGVLAQIPEGIGSVICVNDGSDDDLSDVLHRVSQSNENVRIITHETNEGVGAATVSGYRQALDEGAEVIVKIDSDGQMNPAFIPALVDPILSGEVDYAKGNRFFDIDQVRKMPFVRLIGNAGLSFITKLSTGYWNLFDPTNGFTAIHADVASLLPLDKLHKRYFFESDILFRLRALDAYIVEQPMETSYGDETSHLSVLSVLMTFPFLHLRNLIKRIGYNYFLRNFDSASLSFIGGISLLTFGLVFGFSGWIESAQSGTPATAGTVMISAIPLLVGFQLLLSFLQHDVQMTPSRPIHRKLHLYRVLNTTRKM